MKKILLLDLGTERNELNEPLGIEILFSCIKERFKNLRVDIRWYNQNGFPDKESYAIYDVIAISVNSGAYDRLKMVLNTIKLTQANNIIILGGTIPTFAFQNILQEYPNIFCVRGEGESSFTQLIENINNETLECSINKIPNLAFFNKNKLVTTQRIPVNLSNVPKPYRIFSQFIKEEDGIIRIEGSRGCSWSKCSFCCVKEKYGEHLWRPFPLDYIIGELTYLGNNDFNYPYFTDEDFFGNHYERALELSNRIIDFKAKKFIPDKLRFFISIMTKDVVNPKGFNALKQLKLAGLKKVFIGIESGCPTQLKRYNKNSTVDNNIKAINRILSLGLELDIGFIMFDPCMTFDEIKHNLKFLKSIPYQVSSNVIKSLRLQPFTPYLNLHQEILTGDLDVNQLQYDYSFVDNKVAQVYRFYSDWNGKQRKLIYDLQTIIRGGKNEKTISKLLEDKLIELRRIDIDVICLLVSYFEGEINIQEYTLTISKHEQLRRLIRDKIYKILEVKK